MALGQATSSSRYKDISPCSHNWFPLLATHNCFHTVLKNSTNMSQLQHQSSVSSTSAKGEIGDSEKEPSSPIGATDSPGNLEKGINPPVIPSNLTDWNGPDDPLNPQNWPSWKRHFHVLPPAIISFCGYVSVFSPPNLNGSIHNQYQVSIESILFLI